MCVFVQVGWYVGMCISEFVLCAVVGRCMYASWHGPQYVLFFLYIFVFLDIFICLCFCKCSFFNL